MSDDIDPLDDSADAAMASISRQTKLKISDQIKYAVDNMILVTPQHINTQEDLLKTNPTEFYQQRKPFSIDVPIGFHVTYYHEQVNMIRLKHIIISLDGGKRLPPAEPLSAICEFYGIGSYESIMFEIHRGPRNTADIMDFTSGNLMSKWVAKINNDDALKEVHLLFFDIGDPEGYRFKSEEISPRAYPIIFDTAHASRIKTDTTSASRLKPE